MPMTDVVRVTARIVRTDDGENYTEYRVGGVSYPSAEAVEAALEAR
ncbi:hypothetical protein [Halosimplex pelagicum]|uniref:Uncharacterized protein n=1 Tax=Halosimplex pelagicum TaxID=869886 RepID=A0A7D5P9Z6_9EURY|nr:hypothetical protein [Halosimplex pelagicum]QLH83021.1 hypothetical protein HZS54_15920 [Halosimplex pelagicum]